VDLIGFRTVTGAAQPNSRTRIGTRVTIAETHPHTTTAVNDPSRLLLKIDPTT
jgi:hypothetical protein